MLIAEEYYRSGLLVYLWSKYLWQQILEKRQRNILESYNIAPPEIREMIAEEEYETHRVANLQRSAFESFKGTLNVSLTTIFILSRGFRRLWEKSSEIVAYANFEDANELLRNALFLTMLNSGIFLVTLPFSMLEAYARQSNGASERRTVMRIVLDHCVAQTVLFPFVCMVIAAMKYGGDKIVLWIFVFAEFQLIDEFLDTENLLPLPSGDLRTEIMEITENYKFPLQEIYVNQERTNDNAKQVFLRGFPRARTIVIGKDLVGESNDENQRFTVKEISVITARQLSHWARYHRYIRFIVNQTHLCLHLYTINQILNSSTIYHAFELETRPLAIGLTLLKFCPFFDLYNFVARIIMRKLEFLADEDVKRMHGDIVLKRAIVKTADIANLFPIQDPLYSSCNNPTASIYERIIALNECDLT